MAVSRFVAISQSHDARQDRSFTSRTECERWLNKWITNYVTPMTPASAATKVNTRCAMPDEVMEIPAKGRCLCWPWHSSAHCQLDD